MLFKLVLCALLSNIGYSRCLTIDGPYGDTSLATTFDDLSWLTQNY
jgi:hypothetical protein